MIQIGDSKAKYTAAGEMHVRTLVWFGNPTKQSRKWYKNNNKQGHPPMYIYTTLATIPHWDNHIPSLLIESTDYISYYSQVWLYGQKLPLGGVQLKKDDYFSPQNLSKTIMIYPPQKQSCASTNYNIM